MIYLCVKSSVNIVVIVKTLQGDIGINLPGNGKR